MSDLNKSDSLDSGVLRTVRAFKKQIESQALSDDSFSSSILSWSVLGPLSQLRKAIREACEEIGNGSVDLHLVEDDEFGWPRLSLHSDHNNELGVKLVVGAQDRRNGTIIFFKIYPLELHVELQESDYLDPENTQRTLRLFLRKFFDLVTKKIEEERSVEKKFSNLFHSLDTPDIESTGSSGDDDLFPSVLSDPGDSDDISEDIPLDIDDLFK